MSEESFQYDLVEFIKANAPYLTVSDMADELGCSYHKVENACKKAGITPIKVAEQTKNLIFQFKDLLTEEEFCKKFDFSDTTVYKYCLELGIKMLPSGKKRGRQTAAVKMEKPIIVNKDTIAQRLNTVKWDPNKYGNTHFGIRFFESKDI